MLGAEPIVPSHSLRRAVLGVEAEFDRGRAIMQLAASARDDRESLLGSVVADEQAPRRIRAVAASALADLGTPEAEEILISMVGTADPDCQRAVLRFIPWVGTERALAACEALQLPPEHRSGRARDWAVTLLVHRLGRMGHPILDSAARPQLTEPSSTEARTITASSAEVTSIDAAEQLRWTRRLGVSAERDGLPVLTCDDRATYAVLLDRDSSQNPLETLKERPAVLAAVLTPDPEGRGVDLAHVVLAHPTSGSEVEIAGHRGNGSATFAGKGIVSGAGLSFDLRAVSGPGVRPLVLRGRVSGGKISLDEARELRRGVAPRQPARTMRADMMQGDPS